MHTLLIDDDPISLFLTERLIKIGGFITAVTSFDSPVEALAFLQQQLLASRSSIVVLLDLNMPVLNGWQFLDALAPHEISLQDQCRIYLLTSSVAPLDATRAKDHALVTRLIHKPLDISELREIYDSAKPI